MSLEWLRKGWLKVTERKRTNWKKPSGHTRTHTHTHTHIQHIYRQTGIKISFSYSCRTLALWQWRRSESQQSKLIPYSYIDLSAQYTLETSFTYVSDTLTFFFFLLKVNFIKASLYYLCWKSQRNALREQRILCRPTSEHWGKRGSLWWFWESPVSKRTKGNSGRGTKEKSKGRKCQK